MNTNTKKLYQWVRENLGDVAAAIRSAESAGLGSGAEKLEYAVDWLADNTELKIPGLGIPLPEEVEKTLFRLIISVAVETAKHLLGDDLGSSFDD